MTSKFVLPLKIIQQTGKQNTGTVIFFHGSGDTGVGVHDWINLLHKSFNFPHLKIIYPTAPSRPYTPMNGQHSNVWFDRRAISKNVDEDLESIDAMSKVILNLVEKEVSSGIPMKNIILGGFSMGGALALHLGYRHIPQVAGVFAISSFLNDNSIVIKNLKENPESNLDPLFQWHGLRDDLVPFEWGQDTFKQLEQVGITGQFHHGKNALHELKKECLVKLHSWILERLPE